MLHIIRNYAKGVVLVIIAIFIGVPFALSGIQGYLRESSSVSVATVNGIEIGQQEFLRAYQQQRRQLQETLGGNFDPALFDEAQMKRMVLNRLIRSHLLVQDSVKAGYRVSDGRLAAEIHGIEAFQHEGRFSKETYEQALRTQDFQPSVFETLFREELISNQQRNGVFGTRFASERDLAMLVRLAKQERDIGYIILPAENFRSDAPPGEDAVAGYYESHRDQFAVPEQVSVDYIRLSLEAIAKKVPIDEDALRDRYEEKMDSFGVAERRRVSHILIALPPDADEAAAKAASAKAEAALARARAGEPFDKLAKEYSDDKDSAAQGGDLGFYIKGVMEASFEEVVFGLQAGAVSDPIQTTFGLHVIKLTELQPRKVKPFADVRDQLAREYQQQKAENQFYEQAEILTDLTYVSPDTLSRAARELGVEIASTALFSRDGGEGISANPKVINAAFSEEVLSQGLNSEPLEIGHNDLVVLRLKEHRPAAVQSLQEVRDRVIEQLRRDEARTGAETAGKSIIEQIRAGGDEQALAARHQTQWKRPGHIRRDEQKLPAEIVQAAFKAARPGAAIPAVGGLRTASGDYAVFRVYAVKDGDPAKLEAAEKAAFQRELVRLRGADEYDGYAAGLRRKADIVIHEDAL